MYRHTEQEIVFLLPLSSTILLYVLSLLSLQGSLLDPLSFSLHVLFIWIATPSIFSVVMAERIYNFPSDFCPNKTTGMSLWHFFVSLSPAEQARQDSKTVPNQSGKPLCFSCSSLTFVAVSTTLLIKQQVIFHIWIRIQAILHILLLYYSKVLCFLPSDLFVYFTLSCL